jgi:uncharacterized protein (DUF2141 family)
MPKRMKVAPRLVTWCILGALLAPAGLVAQQEGAPTATLQVTVAGVHAEQGGTLVVALYDRQSTWLTLDSAKVVQRLVPSADSLIVLFEDLPYDSMYAVAVIHDRNANEKLDMRWFPWPKPKEGAGVSRNHIRKGKPRYDEARFAVLSNIEYQRIDMRY